MDRDINVLAFSLPGTGKTYAMCAIGHRLVESGRSVLFIPAYHLVQDMLAAVDRIVHHSVILEFDLPSYRTDAAQTR